MYNKIAYVANICKNGTVHIVIFLFAPHLLPYKITKLHSSHIVLHVQFKLYSPRNSAMARTVQVVSEQNMSVIVNSHHSSSLKIFIMTYFYYWILYCYLFLLLMLLFILFCKYLILITIHIISVIYIYFFPHILILYSTWKKTKMSLLWRWQTTW